MSDDLVPYQTDIDELLDKAQTVGKTASDTRVGSQASQLATRYQTLTLNVKVSYC